MANVSHSDLSGASLHEPKGVENATAGTVYVADGAGSGDWTDPLSDVNNLNAFEYVGVIEDISTASANWMVVVPRAASLTGLRSVMDGAITIGDAAITTYKNGVLQTGTLTVAYTGSAKGITDTLTYGTPISVAAGDYLEFRSDGGSTDACRLYITAEFTAT